MSDTIDELQQIRQEALTAIDHAVDVAQLQEVSRTYVGKKGAIRKKMALLGTLPAEQRPCLLYTSPSPRD